MGTDTTLYDIVVFLHILSVVIGIGGVMLNGVYAQKAQKAGGPAAGAIMQANFDVTMVAEKFIYAIPVFGIALVVLSDKVFEMSQLWLWLSLVLYVVAIGISHGVMIPSGRKMLAGPSGPEEAAALGKKLATGGMTLDLIAVVIIGLMVWKPGF
jgi:uncharacterized membrane protein